MSFFRHLVGLGKLRCVEDPTGKTLNGMDAMLQFLPLVDGEQHATYITSLQDAGRTIETTTEPTVCFMNNMQ
eukprot:2335234-Amphidinium_carterae.1